MPRNYIQSTRRISHNKSRKRFYRFTFYCLGGTNMKNCTFIQMWDDRHGDREVILEEYMTDEYLSRLFTKEELSYIRNTIEASARAQTFDDFCDAIQISGDSIAEEFEIPHTEIDKWRAGEFPSYIKPMIAFFAITNELEYRRTRTCQACGSFFFTADDKEPCCEYCRRDLANSFFDYYLALREDPNIN